MAYSSDLTDEQWEIFEPLLLQVVPKKKRTRPSNWTKREIFNGILYQLKNGCNYILGFPFFTHCTKANVSDDLGLVEMLTLNIDYFKSKPVKIPKITILLDHGYHVDYLIEELQKVYPQIMTKIRFERSTKPSKQEKVAQGKSGFIPVAARWGKRALECLDGAL